MAIAEKIQELREWDQARPGIKGEHWLALGAGLLALHRARRAQSVVGRLVGGAIGTALIARAATGRDGPVALARRMAEPPTLAERLLIASRRR